MDQIDIRTYHDYTIYEQYVCQECPYARGTEMKLICSGLFEKI